MFGVHRKWYIKRYIRYCFKIVFKDHSSCCWECSFFCLSIISSFTIHLGIDELYLGLSEVNVNITYLENLSALVIHLLFLLYSTAFIIRTLWLCGLHYLLFIGKEKCSIAFWYFWLGRTSNLPISFRPSRILFGEKSWKEI